MSGEEGRSTDGPDYLHRKRKRLNFKSFNCRKGDLLGREWKRTFKILIAGLLMIIPLASGVNGDGCVFYGEESLEFLLEEDQFAMIDLENGIQKMLIKIDIEKKDVSNSTWVLPIPATPETVRYDIEANMPSFSGIDLEEGYEEELDEKKKDILSMYYLSFFPGLRILYGTQSYTDVAEHAGGLEDDEGDVTIHSSLDFEGIHSELVSTEDPIALIEYLNGKGLPIQMGSLGSFDHYVENNFSFIITWIDSNSLKGVTPALYIDFPSDRLFYPMLLTGEYGDREVPVSLLINDWVKYEDGIELDEYSEFTYYREFRGLRDPEYESFLMIMDNYPEAADMNYDEIWEKYGHLMRSHYLENQTDQSTRYTYIKINAKATEFTQDLYFKSFEPDVVDKQRKMDSIDSDGYLSWKRFFSFVFFSMLTGMITGLIFFSKEKEKIIISTLISIFNIMAIWVFTIATLIFLRPKSKKDWFRFLGYTAVYHLIFFTLVMVFIEPLFIFI